MKRTTSFLQPTKLYDNNQLREEQALSDVCVLMPSYKGPNQNSRYCVDTLADCGATIVASYGVSDVALHRCIVAAKAVDVMRENPRLNFVIWLDDDMSFTPAHVACLRDYVFRYDVAISGMYCRRGNPFVIAASLLDTERRDLNSRVCSDVISLVHSRQIATGDSVSLYPSTGGLGCLMMKSGQFLRHCKAMPSARYNLKPGGGLEFIPEICSSGLREYGADGRWVSEDEAYCLSLWQHGIGVFTVPVPFGHYSHVPLVPTADALFLGEKRDV